MLHCVKSVQIRSFFWSVFSWIQNEYGDTGKYGPEKNSVFGNISGSVHQYQIRKNNQLLLFYFSSPAEP